MIGLYNLFEKTNPLHCMAGSPAEMKYSFKMFYIVLDHSLSFKMNSEPLHPFQIQSLCAPGFIRDRENEMAIQR